MNPNPTIEQALAECATVSKLVDVLRDALTEGRNQFARDLLDRYNSGDYAKSETFALPHAKEGGYWSLLVDTVEVNPCDNSVERIPPGFSLDGKRCCFSLYGLIEDDVFEEEKQWIGDYSSFEDACKVALRLGGVR